jgi:hypothetical protein
VWAIHRSRELRRRQHIRNNMEARWNREQTRLTITLVAIVFFFIICIMPSAFSDRHIAYAIFASKEQTKRQFFQTKFYLVFQKASTWSYCFFPIVCLLIKCNSRTRICCS